MCALCFHAPSGLVHEVHVSTRRQAAGDVLAIGILGYLVNLITGAAERRLRPCVGE